MKVNTNIISLKTQEYLRKNNEGMTQAQERLASGKRINSSLDDAAGLAVVTRMNVKSTGLDAASKNSSMGIDLLQTADSALSSMSSILQRMRQLAVQSSNGSFSDEDRKQYTAEFGSLIKELDHVADTTNYNNIKLLDQTATSATQVSIQASDKANDLINIDLFNAKGLSAGTITLGSGSTVAGYSALSVADADSSQQATEAIDELINNISNGRALLGAGMSRLSYNVSNVNNQSIATKASASSIEDADMAAEMSEMTKYKILTQTSISMLSQANQTPQMLTQLINS
ncbi:FliC/FljB family flagellin [Listeria monocytogenes]|uniref:FliC/FljB family flagellin n=1 Tax=Listeria monocytogenes TaxID=1639 RepID=UPI001EDF8FD4|nr:FliC/FljB family flagellin [Listeria monocytogenes]MCG3316292.1 FliC/FljB family flagellin [Listeria monocytogenes]MCH5034314.1 FliC/FljB family flagellin [Listeria monocytogenes]MCH5038456.1 FliC/FljB family flagellin [Listeria monocytogenes]